MNEEELQRLWQTQPVPAPANDMNTLMITLRQKHQKFRRTIFWRDFREVGVAIALIPLFLFQRGHDDAAWETYLIVSALIFVAGFLIVDRLRHRPTQEAAGEPLVRALQVSLDEVDHQIWLLRNVLWWYIGPLTAALSIPVLHRMSQGHGGIGSLIFYLAIGYGVWWLNQHAVKSDLKPRRDELQKQLDATL